MAITFPINPLNNQQFAPPGIPVTWQFDSGRNAWRVMRVPPFWSEIPGKPLTFPPSDHDHEIADVEELQNILNIKQDITARGLPSGYAPLDETGVVPNSFLPPGVATGDWNDLTGKPATFPPSPHSHPVVEISDSSSTGQQLVRATGAYAARQVIGAIGPDDNARVGIDKNGVQVGLRRTINFIEGDNVNFEITDDVANEEVDIRINSTGGGGDTGSGLIVSDVKPAAPFNDDMWFDSATGLTFIYYHDGAKAQWIESLPYLALLPASPTKFVFPVAPTDGQTYEPVVGALWKWNAGRGVWVAVTPVADAYTTAQADAKFVDLVGDTMTGPLTLNANPTANLQAATKQYVDARVAKAGDTMTGHLSLPTTPAAANAVRKDYVDSAISTSAATIDTNKLNRTGSDTMSGYLTVTGNIVCNSHMHVGKTISEGGILYFSSQNYYLEHTTGGVWNLVGGRLKTDGDIMCASTIRFNTNGDRYLHWDGTNYSLGGSGTIYTTGNLNLSGYITNGMAPEFTGVTITHSGGYSYTSYHSPGARMWYVGAWPDTTCLIYDASGGVAVITCYAGGSCNISGTYLMFNGNQNSKWQSDGNFLTAGHGYSSVGGVWYSFSDERIKNVVGDYEHGLAEIMQLQPRRYTYKGNDTPVEGPPPPVAPPGEPTPKKPERKVVPRGHANPESQHYTHAVEEEEHVGLIAQECETILPELVTLGNGRIDGEEVNDLRIYNGTPLTYTLINAIKELKALNDTLAARVAALEAA